MKSGRRATVSTVALCAVAGTSFAVVGLTPSAAGATGGSERLARCGPGVSAPDLSAKTGRAIKPGGTPLWSGPSSTCNLKRKLARGTKLNYHCWRPSPEGNKFTYVRVVGTKVEGWVYNGNLNNQGLSAHRKSCFLPGPG